MDRRHAVVFGAHSDIAKALILILIENRYNLSLLCRDIAKMENWMVSHSVDQDLEIDYYEFDALDFDDFNTRIDQIKKPLDVVFLSFGLLRDNQESLKNSDMANEVMQVNYVSYVVLSNQIMQQFEVQGHGKLIAMNSVAGIRGRKSNFIYGSAHAGKYSYYSGLSALYRTSPIQITQVISGYVKTKMTAHLDLPEFLVLHPDRLARRIYAQAIKKDSSILYSSTIWFFISVVLRILPRGILNKLNI